MNVNVPVIDGSPSTPFSDVSPPKVPGSSNCVTDVDKVIVSADIAVSPPFEEASIIEPLVKLKLFST